MKDKMAIIETVVSVLEGQLRDAVRSLQAAHDAIADAPGPMQSHSDTTRFQKSILAQSAGRSMSEKELAIATLREIASALSTKTGDTVALGMIVRLEREDGFRARYIILPYGGGISVGSGSDGILVITPQSPLAVALLGKREWDEIELQTESRPSRYTIIALE